MTVFKADDYIRAGLNLHISKTCSKSSSKPHTHDFLEFVYILAGGAIHNINKVSYPVKAGDMLFINYGSTHSFTTDEKLTYINIALRPESMAKGFVTQENAFRLLTFTAFDEFSENDAVEGVITFSGNERHEIEGILSNMLEEYRKAEPAYSKILDSYTNIIIAKLLRKMYYFDTKTKEKSIWDELLQYIDLNINRRLTLEELANKCFYNPSYFSRMFKEKFQMSLLEYITKKRCETAAELLVSTELSAARISDKCGFSDKAAFYRNFSKAYGQTPQEYRKSKKTLPQI